MSGLEFSDVVTRMIEQYVEDHVYTAIPAKVISVDNFATDQTVDIQPQIVDTFKDNRNVELPPVLDVPIIFPSAGGGLLSFPVSVGDTVLAVFSQKSIDEWVNSDADQTSYTPKDHRTYSLNDAIAISGLYTKNTNLNPNPTDVELKFKNSHLKLQSDNTIVIDNSFGSIAVNPDGSIVLSNGTQSVSLDASGNFTHSPSGAQITSTGDFIDFNGTHFSTHIHSGGGSGPPVPGS